MIKQFCDICSSHITNGAGAVVILPEKPQNIQTTDKGVLASPSRREIEFCFPCAHELRASIGELENKRGKKKTT